MSLNRESWRASFAQCALTGICAQAGLHVGPDHGSAPSVAKEIARWSVMIADALCDELGMATQSEPKPPPCTGISAQWCPRCGDCSCPEGERSSFDCPLHSPSSPHGEEPEQETP